MSERARDARWDWAAGGVIFLLLAVRACAFGVQYWPQLDDYIQYHNYATMHDFLALAKLVVNKGNDCGVDTALALERLGQTAAFSTADHMEGICAFLEKRDPKFEGR